MKRLKQDPKTMIEAMEELRAPWLELWDEIFKSLRIYWLIDQFIRVPEKWQKWIVIIFAVLFLLPWIMVVVGELLSWAGGK